MCFITTGQKQAAVNGKQRKVIGHWSIVIGQGYRSVVMGYGNMLMSAKKYSSAKELFIEKESILI